MKSLHEIGLICVNSQRAKIYLQQLAQQGYLPAQVIYLEKSGEHLSEDLARSSGQSGAAEKLQQVYLAHGLDFNFSIPDFCLQNEISLIRVPTLDINAQMVCDAVANFSGNVLIFAAKGLLRNQILGLGKRFLHIHPGYLPDYKGSTTIYYSLLKQGDCAASAFLMDAGIDTGKLLARRYFKAPLNRQLLDHFYEPYYRSLVLVDVINQYLSHGEFVAQKQSQGGETYHIIHPVLKHLAILGYQTPA